MSQPGSPAADLNAVDPDMAAALGFSSFGTQEQNRPSKKRRFNSQADLPPKPPAPASSGANSLPLHPRGTGSLSNTDSHPSADPYEALKARVAATSPDGALPPGWYPDPDNSDHLLGIVVEPPVAVPDSLIRDRRAATASRIKAGRPPPSSTAANPQWYVDYYDPSSNQNPWERLEQTRGLQAVGPWLLLPSKPGSNPPPAVPAAGHQSPDS